MAVADFRNTHIVTAGYLRRFADRKLIQPVKKGATVTDRPPPAKHPSKVGIRTDFFTDPELAAKAEKVFNQYETRGLEALRRVQDNWPLERGSGALDRLAIAGLVALHMVRNPTFKDYMAALGAACVERVIQEGELSPAAEARYVEEVTSEAFAVDQLLSMIPKGVSLIASAHWTLAEFPDRLLATSDQPVTVVPILPEGTRAPVDAAPRGGFMFAEEIRFPIDPEHGLLFTWVEGRDTGNVVMGTDDLAADLNRAVISQADREWFHHPQRRPTGLPTSGVRIDTCRPIARDLFADYGATQAATSLRRRVTAERIDRMVENEITDEFQVAEVGVLRNVRRRFAARHYHLDTRTEPVECESHPACPVCAGEWIGVRHDGERLVADCTNDHRFAVKTAATAIGKPARYAIGDQLTAPL